MKVWKVCYDGVSQYSTDEKLARTYTCSLFAILTQQFSKYVDCKLTTKEMKDAIYDFASCLPKEVNIAEGNRISGDDLFKIMNGE